MNEDLKKDLVASKSPIIVNPSPTLTVAKKAPYSPPSKMPTISKFIDFTNTKKIIYKQKKQIPAASQLNSNFFLIAYAYIYLTASILSVIMGSIYIMHIYNTPNFDFSNLFIIYIYFSIFFVILNILYFFSYGNRRQELFNHRIQFFCEGIMSFGSLVSSLGIYLYLKNFVDIWKVGYFLYFDLSLAFIVSYYNLRFNIFLVQRPFFRFLFDLQLFFIITKLADNDKLAWTGVMIIFWIIAYFLLIVAAVFVIYLLFFFINALFARDFFPNPFLAFGLIMILGFSTFYCCLFYFTIYGIQNLLEKDDILPLGKKGGGHDMLLYNTMFYFASVSSIFLFLIFIFSIIFYSFAKEYINCNTSNLEISLTSFVKNLRVNMTLASENYFHKYKEGEEIKEIIKLDTCYICYDKYSNTLIKPCSHSGVCKDCVKTLLKKEIYDCPICKKRMEEIFLIFYDEEKKEYLSNGVIKFE